MSLYDVIAAGHQGQCFALLARKFLISEPQAALAVRYLLPVVLPSFEAFVSSPAGLATFLDVMGRAGHEKALASAAVLNNHFERDRGMQLLEQFRKSREFDGAAITQAVEVSGVKYRVLVQLMPFVALFVMAGLRGATEAPCRAILANRLGRSRSTSPDPFGELAELIAWEAKGARHGLFASVLDGLFRPRPGAAPSAI